MKPLTFIESGIRRTLIFSFLLAMYVFSPASSASVVYSITSDNIVLRNAYEAWGGDLPGGFVDHYSNYTISYWYDEKPISYDFILGYGTAYFALEGMQLFDNTNGLKSEFIHATPGNNMAISYNWIVGDLDSFGSVNLSYPAAGSIFISFIGQFGEAGDSMPSGSNFDELVASELVLLLAYAGPGDRIVDSDANNSITLNTGEFTFQSTIVPIPAAAWLFTSGLLGLAGCRKFNKDV